MVFPIIKPVFTFLTNPLIKSVNGTENIPSEGPYIICANHESYLDHIMVYLHILKKINKKVHYLAKKEHFDNYLERKWHRHIGAVPVDRQAGGKEALRFALNALKNGKIIAIYPEGTRSLDGKLQKGRTGAARLALTAKVPVLPVGLNGPFELMPKGKIIPKFNKRIIVNFGKLMSFEEYFGRESDREALREVTTKIMKEIAALAGKEYDFE